MIGALKLRSAVTVLVAALVLTGCTDDDAPAPAPGTVTVGVREPASLLPARVSDSAGRMITGALWTPLTGHDPTTREVTPLAAASVASPDHVVWTIKLRPGLRFHDGSPATAASYVGAWQAALAQRWPGAAVLTDVLRAKDMRAVDASTIELTLDRPFAHVPLVLGTPALYPLPESVLASQDWAGFAGAPVGTGPYRLAEPWRSGTGGRLVKFDGYQGEHPGIAMEITVRVVDEPAAQYDQVRSGALDVATAVPGAGHEAMLAEFGDRHLQWPLPDLTYLSFPTQDRRFADPTVRHAIALAINRAALEIGPLDRQVDPARSVLPPSAAIEPRSGQCRPCNNDPAAATALLEQVGGLAGRIPLYHQPGQEAVASALADQLRGTLGLDVTAMPRPGPVTDGLAVTTRALLTASPGEALRAVAGDYPHPGFTEPLAAADAAAEQAESTQFYRVAENQLLRDLPVLPLWSGHGHAVWTARVGIAGADPVRDIDLASLHVV